MQGILLTVEMGDQATSDQLRDDMARVTGEEVLVQRRQGLDGVASFIAVLQAASPIVAAVLPLIIERARQKKVSRVRLDDLEIENPSDEQVRTLWQRYLSADPERKT